MYIIVCSLYACCKKLCGIIIASYIFLFFYSWLVNGTKDCESGSTIMTEDMQLDAYKNETGLCSRKGEACYLDGPSNVCPPYK